MNIQHCLSGIESSDALITFREATGSTTHETYATIYTGALRLLGGLQHAGLGNGDHLQLKTDGIQAYITALWACWLGGIIPVVADVQGSLDMRNHPGSKILTDDKSIQADGVLIYSELHTQPGIIHPMADEDTALLLYTSGTTTAGRCVALSGANLYEGGLASSVLVRRGVSERYLGWLPLTHIFGLVSSHIVPLFNGFDHCLMHTETTLATPNAWLTACSQYKATVTHCTPSALKHAIRNIDTADIDLSSVYVCLCGGESLRESTLHGFEQAVGRFGWSAGAICPAYGMSETTMGICYNPPGESRRIQHIEPGSISVGGRLVFLQDGGIERLSLGVLDDCNIVEIRDIRGNSLPLEHLGIIHVKGSNVCKGYLPPATPPNPDAQGWLDTGDLGYFKDGWLTVLARQKDVLCHNGINYIRSELEHEACEASGLEHLALVEAWGGLVLAGGYDDTAAMERARAALAEHGLPVYIATLPDLPLTGKGTVDRLALETLLEHKGMPDSLKHTSTGVAQLNERHVAMASLWAKRLHVPVSGLSPDSNFIQLGGDSLALIDLACDIEESMGVYVEATDLGENPTLEAMCRLVEAARQNT